MKKLLYYKNLYYLICKILLITAFIILLNGCGSWKLSQLWSNEDSEKINTSDNAKLNSKNNTPHEDLNPIPLSLPQIPKQIQNLSLMSKNISPRNNKTISPKDQKLLYTTKIICKPKHEDIVKLIKNTIKLYRLAKIAPLNKIGLEFRVQNDEIEINKILKSYGYYSGKILTTVDYNVSPALVKLNLELGSQYKIENTYIKYKDYTPALAPTSLKQSGLPNGSPAISKNILASIDNFSKWLDNNGYPFAKIIKTKYIIDYKTKTLVAKVLVKQGILVHMGDIIVAKDSSVNSEYLNSIKTWKYGDIWNDRKVNRYINKLSQKNIFGKISIKPYVEDSKKIDYTEHKLNDKPIIYNALLEIVDSAQRSVGGGLNYETDRGPGVQAFWEHRNIFSSTESLRISTEISKNEQLADISFKIPDFLTANQNLLASIWINNNRTDAYDQKSAWTGLNIERRFLRYWRFSIGTTLESGRIKEANKKSSGYTMFGVPLNLIYTSTMRPLDRTKGIAVAVQITPYTGTYTEYFSILYGKLDINTYYPIVGDDKVVLALRTTVGSLFNDDAYSIPASIRFYAGGGGSVRGYKYQSIGPKNKNNNPIGGSSLIEINFEARIKITDTIGIVPFIDGGNVFADARPSINDKALLWGAGLGFRYYTAIGPLRLDLATPLNPRDGDAPFFMYISIGQSF